MRVGYDLPESCSKNGAVPRSPLALLSSHSAIGGHNVNSKIDLGFYRGCRRHPLIRTCATPVGRAPKRFENSPEEDYYESTCHTRNDHHSTSVLGSRLISKRFPCSTKVAQRATCWHLDTRLIGSSAPGWHQAATVWLRSEGYQRLRRERSFFCHDRECRQFTNRIQGPEPDKFRGRRPYCKIDRVLRHVHRQRGGESNQPSS